MGSNSPLQYREQPAAFATAGTSGGKTRLGTLDDQFEFDLRKGSEKTGCALTGEHEQSVAEHVVQRLAWSGHA
jgi:hypothetical protein